MQTDSQAIYLNAVPLLALSALYLLAGAAIGSTFLRERRRPREAELSLALLLPGLGIAAALVAVGILRNPEPLGGSAWLGLVAIAIAFVPALTVLVRWRDASTVPADGPEERAARTADEEGARRAVDSFRSGLALAGSPEEVADRLAAAVTALVDVDFVGLVEVRDRVGTGILARAGDGEADWWRELRLDLDRDASGIASAALQAVPVAVFDVESSAQVGPELAERIGAKSAAFVPASAGGSVVGVVVAASTGERHAFLGEEMAVLEELAGETALALERFRSAAALTGALERERLVARISQRLRSGLELEALLAAAAAETGRALGIHRCLVTLGEPPEVAAEWRPEGTPAAAGDVADGLPVIRRAARKRRTIAVPDVGDPGAVDDAGREVLRSLGAAAVLAIPIVALGEAIGVFVLVRGEPGRWSAEHVAVAEAVAHELALAVQTARLLEEKELRLEQQGALLKAAQALGGDLELDSVIRRLVEEVVPLVGGDGADCWLFEEGGRTLRCRAVHGLPASEIGRRIVPEGTIGDAVASGRPLLTRDVARREGPEGTAAHSGFEELMQAPILVAGEVRGVLGVGAREAGRFDEQDLELLETFAGLASLAVRNAEMFEARSRQARVERGFYRIAAVLAEPLSLAGTLDAVAQAAKEALGGSFAAVLMRRSGGLALAGSDALPPPLAAQLAAGLPAAETALPVAARDGRMLAAPALAEDDRFAPELREAARAAGATSLLAIPVDEGADAGESEAGVVLVFFGDRHAFSDDDVELAQQVAGAARGALERSRLFEEERSARSLAQQLARTGTLLSTELDPAAILDEVVRQAPSLVGVEACAIRVLDGDELVVIAAEGPSASLLGERSGVGDRLSGDVAQSRSPVAVADASADDRLAASDPLLAEGFRAYLGVPLAAAEGGLHGVLSLYAREPRAWRRDEVEALMALAANVSAALSNAELYQRVAIEKERSFAILANIADGIVAVDRDGHVVLWNNAAEEITGVPASEALGRTPQEVLGRELESDAQTPLGDRLVSILRGGEEVWLSLTEAIMRDPAGAVAGRIYAFRDISAERLVEQMKTEFVSTVSQELRRPLTSIYGFAETLLRRDVLFGEEERQTFLGYIASESERLTTIVDALLNVARVDSGDLQINLATTDVAGAVGDIVSELEARAGDGHQFVVDLPPEPLAAEADPDKLRQVLANLVDNAVKYSPAGGTVTVSARRRDERIEISVTDEGVGIPQAEQERIFRKFYRADSAGLRAGLGGTGVGLFIVQGLVAAMGGRIWVTSREGEGSSFTFELPAAAVARTEAAVERV